MKTHLEMLAQSNGVTVHTKRGRYVSYGSVEFPFQVGNHQSEKVAKTAAYEHAIAWIQRMRQQKKSTTGSDELSIVEQTTGEFDRSPEPSQPRSAREEQRAAPQTLDSEKIPTMKNLTPAQQAGLDRARAKLKAKEANAAQQKEAAESPARKKLVDFCEKVLKSKQSDPAAKSSDVIIWSDFTRAAKNVNKPTSETWAAIRATDTPEPSKTVGEEV
jgi:hypothetical protein